MSHPARYEIEKFANDAFAVAQNRILTEYAEKWNHVQNQVTRTGNRGGYLPALAKWGAERERETILALADAYADAFTLFGVPSDARAASDLKTSSLQIAAGTISGIRGQLDLMSKRTRKPLNDGAGYIERVIEQSRVSALAEGKLKLERQRIKTVAASRAAEAIQQRYAIRAATTAELERQPVGKRKRGRPQTISDAKKAEAAGLKASGGTNKQAAAVLYDTKYPSDQQRKNVPAILRHHQQKSKQSDSPINTRRPSPKPGKTKG